MKATDNRAATYVRVSTKRQEKEGYSTESQIKATKAYAEKEGPLNKALLRSRRYEALTKNSRGKTLTSKAKSI